MACLIRAQGFWILISDGPFQAGQQNAAAGSYGQAVGSYGSYDTSSYQQPAQGQQSQAAQGQYGQQSATGGLL